MENLEGRRTLERRRIEERRQHPPSVTNHLQSNNSSIERSLKIAVILTSGIFIVELLGSFASGSLSLLGDAGHMLRDMFALTVSLSAVMIAKKLPTKERTFGYHRVEILAALLNGILLIVISGWIFWEAYIRLFIPVPIQSFTMLMVATSGLLVNIIVAYSLHDSHDLNVRSAFVHVMTDLFSSAAVVLAAAWIYFTGHAAIDPVLGIIIAGLVLISALRIIRESMHILLGFAPKDVNFNELMRDIESVKGVEGVNNVHLWSLCSNVNIIDAHVLTKEPNMTKIEAMKAEIKSRLEKYNIKHATLEFECEECMECRECKQNGSKVRKIRD